MIGHLNKTTSGKKLYRGLGSIDIAAIARSVLMIARDERNHEIRYMYPIKSSLSPEGKTIRISARTVRTAQKELGVVSRRKKKEWFWELPSLEEETGNE